MSNNSISEGDLLWKQLVQAHQTSRGTFDKALEAFKTTPIDHAAIVGQAIRNGRDIITAIRYLEELTAEQSQQIFPELVYLASWVQGSVLVRNVIISLPRAWVLERIEAVAEHYLEEYPDEGYRRLLELFILLDPKLTERLARRASAHPNPEVQEAGRDFLD